MDEEGMMLFLFIKAMGMQPAAVLRAIGRDATSGSKNYEWLKRRVSTFQEVIQPTPQELWALRYLCTRPDLAGCSGSDELLKKVICLNPKLFSKPSGPTSSL